MTSILRFLSYIFSHCIDLLNSLIFNYFYGFSVWDFIVGIAVVNIVFKFIWKIIYGGDYSDD